MRARVDPVEREAALPQMRGHPELMRTPWAGLPATVRTAVTAHTGFVTAAVHVPDGYNCDHAAILTTAAGGHFVKGTRGEAAAGHDWEAGLNPLLDGISPALRWRVAVGGWDLLGFDALSGRHAHLAPGSPDLPLFAGLLARSSTVTAPDLPLPAYADRFAAHAAPGQLALLDGNTLIHADINQHNIHITDTAAWLVDWATPARGPAWADIAEACIRLMEDGHTAAGAYAWAQQIPSWRAADPAAITAWADLRCRMWAEQIGERDAAPSNTRHQALAAALRAVPAG